MMARRSGMRSVAAIAIAGATSCVDLSYERGIAIDVVVEPRTDRHRMTTDLGFEVELDEAFVVVESFELLECPTSSRFSLPFGIGRAHAHTSPATRTRLATPLAIDLAGERPDLPYGSLTPAPSTFCSARVTFGPADTETANTPDGGHLVGRTLFASGRYRRTGEPEWRALSIAASLTQVASIPLQLHLDAPQAVRLVLGFDRDAHWLDGVPLDDASAARVALERLVQSFAEVR